MSAPGKPMTALAYSRLPDWETSETEEDWSDSVQQAFEVGTVDDSRAFAHLHTVQQMAGKGPVVVRLRRRAVVVPLAV